MVAFKVDIFLFLSFVLRYSLAANTSRVHMQRALGWSYFLKCSHVRLLTNPTHIKQFKFDTNICLPCNLCLQMRVCVFSLRPKCFFASSTEVTWQLYWVVACGTIWSWWRKKNTKITKCPVWLRSSANLQLTAVQRFFVQPNHIDTAQTVFLSFSTHVGQMRMKNDHSYHCKPDSFIKDSVFLSWSKTDF